MKGLITLLLLSLSFYALAKTDESGKSYGIVNLSVVNLRAEPKHSSEMISQAVGGTPLEILSSNGEWLEVRLPDGYEGFVHSSGIDEKTEAELNRWKDSDRLIVVSPEVGYIVNDTISISPFNKGNVAVCDFVEGCIVELLEKGDRFSLVKLGDTKKGYISTELCLPLKEWAEQGTDTWTCVESAKSMVGIPYLWGGVSSKGLDCSGLTKDAFYLTGVIIPRDASQQAAVGVEIPYWRSDLWMKGDLLFFTGEDGKTITHVGIYDSNGEFIHSSGSVQKASVNEESELYLPRKVVKVRRILGSENTKGIVKVKNHPWYFGDR